MTALDIFSEPDGATMALVALWSLVIFWAGYRLGGAREQRGHPYDRDRMQPPRMPLDPPTLSAEARAEIEAAILAGEKIEAIHLMRRHTGLGLAESKGQVEVLASRLKAAGRL
ncbi:hypothetical protein GCM10011371_20030 [Novosphingobium marinum]|uniref:Ribosomal protein L7/L12 C-terminal domain-containing protein n=1 Tax=Novosphingobium marinum TaxID=1514948 RepID=A0A7Y9XX99_9SPHN|nr:hypothetical protein [Novosphingobium marinum]NYH96115.1 hypothetical protein [Novosphingobium marinum]GGC32616.1 hypothetical protein GCM10011371_20030 [Novosphingobium marinum]